MTIALVANSGWALAGGSGGTTTAIDTTGASLLVIATTGFNNSHPTVSDNKGNTWTFLVGSGNTSGGAAHLFYSASPTVGTGHTVTVSTNQTTCALAAFSGTAATPTDGSSGNNASAGNTSLAPGSITPSVNNDLIISVAGGDTTNSFTAPTGFTMIAQHASSSGNFIGSAVAYELQTTAAAVNPTWAFAAAFSANGVVQAAFEASSGGATFIPAWAVPSNFMLGGGYFT